MSRTNAENTFQLVGKLPFDGHTTAMPVFLGKSRDLDHVRARGYYLHIYW